MSHHMVYYEQGRFGGWPANHGMWSWGDEILVGFSRGFYKDLGPNIHHIDREKPEEHLLARSLDGGETWSIEEPSRKGQLIPKGAGDGLHGRELPGVLVPEAGEVQEPIDFTHPDFAMTLRMTSVHAGESRMHYSYDRGKNWRGPFLLPSFDTRGTAARTNYIVDGPSDCLLFLTAAKSNGKEGRPFCAFTEDGGRSWEFLSWIGEEPEGFSIMPSAVRLSDRALLAAVRRREKERRWIGAFLSEDNGKTWRPLEDPVEDAGEGNPPCLLSLQDGRVCLTYGVRAEPFRICAKISRDGGQTWGPELVLRDDGGCRDIGYVRSAQRRDGTIVTAYYFQDEATGPERYIAATLWHPDSR